jgi:hypothetical protein
MLKRLGGLPDGVFPAPFVPADAQPVLEAHPELVNRQTLDELKEIWAHLRFIPSRADSPGKMQNSQRASTGFIAAVEFLDGRQPIAFSERQRRWLVSRQVF